MEAREKANREAMHQKIIWCSCEMKIGKTFSQKQRIIHLLTPTFSHTTNVISSHYHQLWVTREVINTHIIIKIEAPHLNTLKGCIKEFVRLSIPPLYQKCHRQQPLLVRVIVAKRTKPVQSDESVLTCGIIVFTVLFRWRVQSEVITLDGERAVVVYVCVALLNVVSVFLFLLSKCSFSHPTFILSVLF